MSPLGLTLASEPVMDMDSGDRQAVTGSGNESGASNNDATFLDFNNALGDGFEVHSNWSVLDSGVVPFSSGSGIPDDIQGHDSTETGPNNIWDGPSSVPTTGASSVFEPSQPRTAPYDCEDRAFAALRSLHSCTMLHTDHPGEAKQITTLTSTDFGGVTDPMPPLDKVLYFNRAAISTLKELLNARCVQESHLALLYMTIASKVLFWYRLVVSSQYPSKSRPAVPSLSSSSSSTDQLSPPGTWSSTSDRAVKPVSFQIGVFDLGDEDQKLLMKGVLLREVRKLESVVGEMKRLGDEHTRDDEYHDEQHVLNWYAVAGTKLQAEVQDTLRQIKELGAGITG
ncbi:MAG: hypothetical protein Q9225_005522 [Loekoesia sp. 1 TL-2023]